MSVRANSAATGGIAAARRTRAADESTRARGRTHLRTKLRQVCVLALGLILVAAGPGAAQDLTLRSGDHDEFTRLTLPLPAGADWRLERAERGYRLMLENAAYRFDLSRAFARIGRDRIAALRSLDRTPDEGAELAIDLACLCHIRAFKDSTGLLVLDIRDGPPSFDSTFQAPLARKTYAAEAAVPGSAVRGGGQTDGYDWITSGLRATERFGKHTSRVPDGARLTIRDRFASPPSHAAYAGTAARTMLKRDFTRAADLGLLGLTGQRWAAAQSGLPLPAAPAPFGAALPQQIKVETALDRVRRTPSESSHDASPQHADCPASDALNVSSWGDEANGFASVSRLRSRLVGEFDKPDTETLAALVRGYLHLGFGAEARAVLAAFPGKVDDAAILDALAIIMDGDAPVPGTPFQDMARCDGPAALWALLARHHPDTDRPFNRSAVIATFSALPLHLRRHLGPRLTDLLLAADAIEAAESVRAALDRPEGGRGADLDMIAAEIELAEGRRSSALDRLARLARGNSAHAPAALALFAETRLDAGERIGESIAQAIAAGALAHRGTALGERLARLEVLGLAAAGQFIDAFAARDRQARHTGAPAPGLTDALFEMLVRHGNDIEFLSRAFSESSWHGGGFALETRLALAERLLELGFPRPARQALAPVQDASTRERRLHARAALALDEPAQALRLIAGERGNAATHLRGAALTRLGDHRAATAAFRAAKADSAMLRAAWLAGDGAIIAEHGTELQRAAMGTSADLSAAATTPSAPAPAGNITPDMPISPAPGEDDMPEPAHEPDEAGMRAQGPLQSGHALLERSARMRATLDDLLNTYPAP